MRRLVAMVVCAAMVVSVGCSREPGKQAAPDATGGTCLIAPIGSGPDGTAVGVINTGGKFLVKPDYDFAEVAGDFIILQRFDRLGLAYRDGRILAPCVNTWAQAGNVSISIEDGRWGCTRRRAVTREALGFAAGGVGASDGKDGSVFAFRQDGTPLVRSGFKPTGVVAGRFIIARRESGGKLRVFDAVGSDVCGREFDGESCVVYASEPACSPLLSFEDGLPASLHFMGRPFARAEDTDYRDKPEQDYDLPGGGIAPDDLPFVIVMTSGGKSLVYDRDFRRLSDREFDEVGLLGGGKVAVRIGSRWGFIDLARGADIPAMYGNVAFFSEGLCPVQVRLLANGDIDLREAWDSKGEAPGPLLWGYLDDAGKFAIRPRYHAAGEFSGGVAKVTLEEAGKADVKLTIDRQGNLVKDDASTARADREICPGVTLSKDRVLTWKGEKEATSTRNVDEAKLNPESKLILFRVEGKWGYAAPGTDEWDWAQYDAITPWSKSLLLAKGDRGSKLIDSSGAAVVPDADRFGELSEGLAPFHNESLDLWGYLDEQGRVAIIPFFDEAGSFSEGLAPARRDDLWGFLNRKGEWAIAAEFEGARPFRQGLASVRKSGLWGAIDANGRVKIPFAYVKPLHFVEGLTTATVARPYGIMGSDGKVAVKPRFRTIPVWTDGIAVMAENGRFGAINPRGEYVIPPKYAELKYIGDGLLTYRLDLISEDWGLISTTGEVLCEPLTGVIPMDVSEAMIRARNWNSGPGKYGFLDPSGKWHFSPAYEWVGRFSEGLAAVETKGGKYGILGFVDRNGTVVIRPQYVWVGPFSGGLAPFKRGGKWGFLDRQGREVIAAKYDSVREFRGGYAWAERGSNTVCVSADGTERPLCKGLICGKVPDGYIVMAPRCGPGISLEDAAIRRARLHLDNEFTRGNVDSGQYTFGVKGFDGIWIIQPEYDLLEAPDGAYPLIGCRDGKNCYVDENGVEMFVDGVDLGPFRGGLAVCLFPGSGYRVIDMSGKTVLRCSGWVGDFAAVKAKQ